MYKGLGPLGVSVTWQVAGELPETSELLELSEDVSPSPRER